MNQWWAIVMLLSGGLFAGSVGRSPGNPSPPGGPPASPTSRPFADTCARSTAAAGPVGHPPSLHQLGLTPRDREALALVANGRSNRQIAEALFVRPKTAGAHVSNILAKLGVAGRVDRPPPRPRLRPARRRQPPDQATGWHNEILVMPLAQPGPPCVSPACWHAGLDELPARVAGRFARVEPRWHARAFVLALLVPLDHPW